LGHLGFKSTQEIENQIQQEKLGVNRQQDIDDQKEM